MSILIGLIALLIAYPFARHLYEVRYPKPGTRPSFLAVMGAGPASMILMICLFVAFFAILG